MTRAVAARLRVKVWPGALRILALTLGGGDGVELIIPNPLDPIERAAEGIEQAAVGGEEPQAKRLR